MSELSLDFSNSVSNLVTKTRIQIISYYYIWPWGKFRPEPIQAVISLIIIYIIICYNYFRVWTSVSAIDSMRCYAHSTFLYTMSNLLFIVLCVSKCVCARACVFVRMSECGSNYLNNRQVDVLDTTEILCDCIFDLVNFLFVSILWVKRNTFS